MTYNIIKTDNYLLIVDDSEIKEGDYYLSKISNDVFRRSKDGHWIENYDKKMYHKVIAHLPLDNSPILEGVPLLPPFEQDDNEKLALKAFLFPEKLFCEMKSCSQNDYLLQEEFGLDNTTKYREVLGYIKGYNRAKEKYKWTDEDVIKIVEKSRETGLTAEYLLLTMSQPKMPIEFECEMEWYNPKTNQSADSLPEITGLNDNDGCYMKPKTTTDSRGQTVWAGTWIY